ncbi:hypothetical protein J437_LFUL014960 [Ladona fulva]|uniref:Uncharacterized protein n=1 Tax=Ladona fulva TaxID=123851 RepID=A0A8K0PE40_LADFU|nr:hypothetical protein J437_LFUL014960 [Ladona fulva]
MVSEQYFHAERFQGLVSFEFWHGLVLWSISYDFSKYEDFWRWILLAHKLYKRNIGLQGSLSLEEALRILAEDKVSEVDVADLFISPSEGNELKYEDEGGLVDNLTGRQLRAEAEIHLASSKRIGAGEEDRIGKTIRRKWIISSIECVGNFPDGDYSPYSNLSCVDLFKLFIDD